MTIKKPLLLFAVVPIFIYSLSGLAWGHEWIAPPAASKIENPIAATTESIKTGYALFQDYCASCHGKSSQGLAPSVTGFEITTPNLIISSQRHTDGDLLWKIQTGRGKMPSFQNGVPPSDIWHIINYLKSRAQKKAGTFK